MADSQFPPRLTRIVHRGRVTVPASRRVRLTPPAIAWHRDVVALVPPTLDIWYLERLYELPARKGHCHD